MLRVSSILQLQSVWERPSIEDNNSIMTSRLDEHITRTLSHKSFGHQHEEQEINNTNEEMNISALAIATTSAAKMVVPPLESSNSVHSDRGNSKPNKGMVENENSLHASSLNTNVPMSPSSILDENLLRNKPLPELKITTSSSINQQQQIMTSSSSFTSPLSSSSISSTLSSTFHPSQQQQQQQLQNSNKVENNDPVITIQDTTSSISSDSSDSNSSSSSKKANIPSTPKELDDDDDDDDSDQKKTAKRKPSFSFKRYSFLNKPDGNGNSPPTSLHSFHLPPSPSLMINGANQALRRESSRLNLRRKSFSKKVKKAISNIKLNNPTPTPAA